MMSDDPPKDPNHVGKELATRIGALTGFASKNLHIVEKNRETYIYFLNGAEKDINIDAFTDKILHYTTGLSYENNMPMISERVGDYDTYGLMKDLPYQDTGSEPEFNAMESVRNQELVSHSNSLPCVLCHCSMAYIQRALPIIRSR